MTGEPFHFDEINRCFRAPAVCPNPECASPVDSINLPEAVGWCSHCQRPYEIRRLPAVEGTPMILRRRPHSAFCTQTGQKLVGYSLVDWCETGGGPGRTNCVNDPYGALFGPPDFRVRVRLRPDATLEHESVLNEPDDDWVSALLVVRGQVVVVTALGRIRIFDAETGRPSRAEALDWTGEISTSTEGYDLQVRFAPAFRGTRMVINIMRQAQFRELHPFLFDGDPADSRPVMVEPDGESVFLGPPLGLAHRERPVFCLLQGRATESSIEDSVLLFFDPEGTSIGRCEAPDIARPPVFDRATRQVVWVTRDGAVVTLPASKLASGEASRHRPVQLLDLRPNDRPLLIAAAAPLTPRRTELWVANQPDPGGRLTLFRAVLDELLARPEAPWYWDRQKELEKLGALQGFAVGIGSSHHRRNAAGQLIGVSTNSQVLLLDRGSTDTATLPIPYGSYDPPILSSAGMIARCTDERLRIDHQRTGWMDRELHPDLPIYGQYDRPQGLVQYGRRILLGHGLGLRAFRLELEREEST